MSDETKVPLDRLEHEVEETRANVAETINELQNQVAGTVEDLRAKLQPDEIRREVRRYVQDSARRVGSRLGERAANHPAAAVAIGAAALWPVVKLARNVPLPIYLIAAGVGLMKPMGRLGSRVADSAGEAASRVNEQMRDFARPVMRSASQAQSAMAHAASQVAHTVSSAAESVTEAGSRMLHPGRSDGARSQALQYEYRDYPAPYRPSRSDLPVNGWALALIGVGLGAAAAVYVPKMLAEARREEEERLAEERARKAQQARKRRAAARPRRRSPA